MTYYLHKEYFYPTFVPAKSGHDLYPDRSSLVWLHGSGSALCCGSEMIFFADPDPNFQIISDQDPDPA
jgi:hypothetical protein